MSIKMEDEISWIASALVLDILQGKTTASEASRAYEPAYDLPGNSVKSARWINYRLVLSLRSQFFHNRPHFSGHEKVLSSIRRLGMTAKVCSSLLLTICTAATSPKHNLTASVNG